MATLRLEHVRTEDDILHISLHGSLDMEGSLAIDLKFTALTGTEKAAILVDISEVDFLASIGIRTLLRSAQGAAARGGKLVLYKPQPLVAEVLHASRVSTLIPVFDDRHAALETLRAGRGA